MTTHYNPHDELFVPRRYNRDENGQILFAGSGNARKESNPMETAPTYVVANPLAESIEEGNVLIERIQIASDHLQTCIAEERGWFAKLRESESAYEMAEMETVADLITQGQIKEGPLAGLATSSKAYDVVLNYERIKLRTGKLQRLWQSLEYVRRSYEQSQIALRQAETNFAALRKAVELKAAALRAASL